MVHIDKSFKLKRLIVIVMMVLPIIGGMILAASWSREANVESQQLRQKAEAAAQSVKIPSQLQLQSKEWESVPWWIPNAPAPSLTFSYKLTISKGDAYTALKQAFNEACGGSAGDEEGFMYLTTHCGDGVAVMYSVEDNNTAKLWFAP